MSSDAKRMSNRRYYERNAERRKEYFRQYWRKMKREVLQHYGDQIACATCGESDLEKLQLDHINNDGGEHRRLLISRKEIYEGYEGVGFYRYLKRNNYLNNPPLQILCKSCNIAKENRRRH